MVNENEIIKTVREGELLLDRDNQCYGTFIKDIGSNLLAVPWDIEYAGNGYIRDCWNYHTLNILIFVDKNSKGYRNLACIGLAKTLKADDGDCCPKKTEKNLQRLKNYFEEIKRAQYFPTENLKQCLEERLKKEAQLAPKNCGSLVKNLSESEIKKIIYSFINLKLNVVLCEEHNYLNLYRLYIKDK